MWHGGRCCRPSHGTRPEPASHNNKLQTRNNFRTTIDAMPLVIPPGYCHLAVKFKAGGTGRNCISSFGLKVASAPTQSDLDAMINSVAAQYKLIIKSPGRFEGARLLIGQDGGDPIELNSVSGAGVGSAAVASLTPQVQILVRKGTALAGRRNRGRTFWPDTPETNVQNDGTLDSALITSYQTVATDLLGIFAAGSVFDGMVLLHQTSSLIPTPVTTYQVQSKVATLRPRYER